MRHRLPFVLAVSLIIAATAPPSLALAPASEATPYSASAQQQTLQLISEIGGTINAVTTWSDYAFAGVGRRLVMLDVADPSDPAVVWQSDPLPGSVNAVAIDNGRAYVGAGNTLTIFTINVYSTPPVALSGGFEFVAWDDPPYSATDVAVQGDTAYVTFARGDWLSGGEGLLQVVDASVPNAPTGLGAYDFDIYVTSLALDGSYAVVCSRDGLAIVDVSDPSSPYVRGVSEDVLGGWDVAVSGSTAYVASASGDGFRIFDVSDPDDPRQVGSYKTRWTAYGVAVDYPYAYVTDTEGGLHILGISNPASPAQVGSYDLSASPDGEHLAAWYLAVAGDTAYVVIDKNSLHVVDVGDRADPSKLGSYEAVVADPTSVDVVGTYAYVTDDRRGLTILDVANPAAPQVVGVWEKDDPLMWPVDVSVAGDYAYVLDYFELIAIDVSNPAAPFEAGRYKDPSGGFTSLTVAGDSAYVIAVGKGLFVFDLSNPAVPTMVSTGAYDFDEGVGTYFLGRPIVDGNRLYTSCNGRLCVANVANPANPSVQAKHETAGFVSGVDIAPPGPYLAVAEAYYRSGSDTKQSGLRVLDRNYLPLEVGYVQIPSACPDTYCPLLGALADDGREVYLVGEEPVLRVVDLRDASTPALAGSFDLPVGADHVVADDDHAYVPLREIGLMLFRYVPRTTRSISPSGGVLASVVDGTSYTFPPGTFAQPATVTHTPLTEDGTPPTGSLAGTGHAYEVSALDDGTGQPVQPSGPYTVTIAYSDAEVGPALEETLALYAWDGEAWVEEPTSHLDMVSNTVTATPDHFSTWAVLGETRRVFLPMMLKAHRPSSGPIILLDETFEGDFPGDWEVSDGYAGGGEYHWARRDCRAYRGSHSAWAVGGGADGAGLSCAADYPNNVDSRMIHGPFSLADATDAELSFKLWLNSENGDDSIAWLASKDGASFRGYAMSGSTGGWVEQVFDLTAVDGLGDLTGESQVWIAFRFQSDGSTNMAEGAYLDDIVLRKATTGAR